MVSTHNAIFENCLSCWFINISYSCQCHSEIVCIISDAPKSKKGQESEKLGFHKAGKERHVRHLNTEVVKINLCAHINTH